MRLSSPRVWNSSVARRILRPGTLNDAKGGKAEDLAVNAGPDPRRLLVGAAAAAALVLNCVMACAQQRRPIAFLTARAVDGKVRLACFKSTPLFEATRKEKPDSVRLRIWRAELPGFRFGKDYDEFFDGLSWQDARIIFEGTLPLCLLF